MPRHTFRIRGNKVLKQYKSRNSYLREKNALEKLRPHPLVTEISASYNSSHDRQFICEFRYYNGCDLHDWIECHNNGSDMKFVRYVIKKIMLAYDYAAKLSIFHRDLKPENIMIDEFGIVKVIDWELCSFTKISSKRVGTVQYMAEEVFRGKIYECVKSDIWSLGIVIFCLATGKRPFSSFTSEENYSVFGFNSDEWLQAMYEFRWRTFWRSHENVETFPSLPTSLKNCIEHMLKKEPDDRINLDDLMPHTFFNGDEYNEREIVEMMRASVTARPFI